MQGMGVLGMETSLSPPHQVGATLTLPFDVVKTQRQVALGAVEALRGEEPWLVWGRAGGVGGAQRGLTGPGFAVIPPHTDSTWLLLRRILAESGTRGLFAGGRLCVYVHTLVKLVLPGTRPLTLASPSPHRLPPEDHQGRPFLRHHDQHL